MRRSTGIAAPMGILIGLLVCVDAQAAAPPARSPEGAGEDSAGQARVATVPLDSANAEIRALLSSIDMTVSLIDAYGQCRDEGMDHDQCMSIIRETLDHARGLIGR